MKMRVDTPALRIIRIAADKLGLRTDQPDDLKLCEVKSTGGLYINKFHPKKINSFDIVERIVYKESDLSISHGLSLNGRLFLAPGDHLDALVCDKMICSVHEHSIQWNLGSITRTRRSSTWYLAKIGNVWFERTCLCNNNA